jgi:hypothetical protein
MSQIFFIHIWKYSMIHLFLIVFFSYLYFCKTSKFFIYMLLDRALIILSNCAVFIWFIPSLDRKFGKVLKAPKTIFCTVIFRYKKNISLKQNLIVTKVVLDWRDLWEACLYQVLDEMVLYPRGMLKSGSARIPTYLCIHWLQQNFRFWIWISQSKAHTKLLWKPKY